MLKSLAVERSLGVVVLFARHNHGLITRELGEVILKYILPTLIGASCFFALAGVAFLKESGLVKERVLRPVEALDVRLREFESSAKELKRMFLREYMSQPSGVDFKSKIAESTYVDKSGVIRPLPEKFRSADHAFVFGLEDKLTQETSKRLYIAQRVVSRYGSSRRADAENTYIILEDNFIAGYWPAQSDFVYLSDASFDFNGEIYYLTGKKEYSPDRTTKWTNFYMDKQTGIKVATVVEPIYINDEMAGIAAHDITFNEISTYKPEIEGIQWDVKLSPQSELTTSGYDKKLTFKMPVGAYGWHVEASLGYWSIHKRLGFEYFISLFISTIIVFSLSCCISQRLNSQALKKRLKDAVKERKLNAEGDRQDEGVMYGLVSTGKVDLVEMAIVYLVYEFARQYKLSPQLSTLGKATDYVNKNLRKTVTEMIEKITPSRNFEVMVPTVNRDKIKHTLRKLGNDTYTQVKVKVSPKSEALSENSTTYEGEAYPKRRLDEG